MHVDQPELTAEAIASLADRIDRPVVLVGMMGAGKSSVGRRLAALLHWPFVDADDEIERAAQMSIPEIFDAYGEDYFRDGERRVIARLLDDKGGRKVIATGGGAFCHPVTQALILDKGIAVWLDADVDTLVERTGRKDNRPLLRGVNRREILARLCQERRAAYAKAPIRVISNGGPHGRTVAGVLKGLQEWL
jgi:shikimate kinase